MSNTPVLALPNFKETFIVVIGTCDLGVGVVLLQKNQTMAYLSKNFTTAHKHLSIYEKKFLALVMAVKKWRPYL